jgi:adenosylcobinamide-GDP ribazoletransferase
VVRGFVIAARYLTIVPLPDCAPADAMALGRSAAWFPIVGVLLGLGLAGGDRVLSWLFPPILAALLTVTAWKLVTGGLHLDGLADSLDGLMGRDRAERLQIMRDSRIGVFGAVGLILTLLLELTALAGLPPGLRWRALVAVPAVGRAAPPLLAWVFGSARGDGQGAAFARGTGRRGAGLAALLAFGIALFVLGAAGVAAFGFAAAVVIAVAIFLAARLGGLTGDSLGAAVELAELGMLLAVAAWAHLGLPE